jgi:hypothetical protein
MSIKYYNKNLQAIIEEYTNSDNIKISNIYFSKKIIDLETYKIYNTLEIHDNNGLYKILLYNDNEYISIAYDNLTYQELIFKINCLHN